MSEAPGSTPNFLASLIFTFSSISSLITSWRLGFLWVETKSSLERCSMSKSVIGSPLTITATVCACAGEPGQTIPNAQAATQLTRRLRSRYENAAATIMFDLNPSELRFQPGPGSALRHGATEYRRHPKPLTRCWQACAGRSAAYRHGQA